MDSEKPPLLETDDHLGEVWVQLDPPLRARAVRLLAQMAYNFVIAQREITSKGNSHEREIRSENDSA
jgi:hypothetical protein